MYNKQCNVDLIIWAYHKIIGTHLNSLHLSNYPLQSTKSKLAAQKIVLWLAITPFTMTQLSKVRGALENLGNSLYDGHWNFPFMAKGSWENEDKKFQLVFLNHGQNQLLWTDYHTKN